MHGVTSYAQAVQIPREGRDAKLERRPSRRFETASVGAVDYCQDYAGDYPVERNSQAQTAPKTRNHTSNPWHALQAYFDKWRGGLDDVRAVTASSVHLLHVFKSIVQTETSAQALPVPPVLDIVICYIGAFLGILWVAGCAHALDNQLHENILVASMGATAVLIYGVMESKLAQPRNVIGDSPIVACMHQPNEANCEL